MDVLPLVLHAHTCIARDLNRDISADERHCYCNVQLWHAYSASLGVRTCFMPFATWRILIIFFFHSFSLVTLSIAKHTVIQCLQPYTEHQCHLLVSACLPTALLQRQSLADCTDNHLACKPELDPACYLGSGFTPNPKYRQHPRHAPA